MNGTLLSVCHRIEGIQEMNPHEKLEADRMVITVSTLCCPFGRHPRSTLLRVLKIAEIAEDC
jgi:hypothetical protein